MKPLTLLVATGLLLGAFARAAEPAPSEEPAKAEEAPAATAGYKLQHRSTFEISTEARNPFAPIGWSKEAALIQAAPVVPKITLDAASFNLTSILMGVPRLAVINGRAYGEGEMMRAPRNLSRDGKAEPSTTANPPVPWQQVKIVKITDGLVLLACGESTVQIGLKRNQLGERRPEEQPVFNEQ